MYTEIHTHAARERGHLAERNSTTKLVESRKRGDEEAGQEEKGRQGRRWELGGPTCLHKRPFLLVCTIPFL